MAIDYQISITIDKRRKNKNGKYPVRLQVFTSKPRVQKRYATKFNFTEDEFASIWETKRPRKVYQDTRKKMQALLTKAEGIAEKLKPFTFEEFERKLYRNANDGISLKYQYEEIIKAKTRLGKVGSADAYDLSMKSISDYTKNRIPFVRLTFYDITPAWLEEYEHYMTAEKKKSKTTVGIYLRALRAVFNKAIDEGEIESAHYPFGKRKYQIPAGRNTKKALSSDQLGLLYAAEPLNKEQEKAKDFWFFSFACNGMNVKDIALLQYKDLLNDRFVFYRSKTQNTAKTNLKPVVVYLNDFSKSIIRKYSSIPGLPDDYIFKIVDKEMNPKEVQREIKNFTRFISQHLKGLCKANGLPGDISFQWARHSYATSSIRKGASMEFMQESLGHGNIITTQKYFAGFDDDTKKEFANSIMDFNK